MWILLALIALSACSYEISADEKLPEYLYEWETSSFPACNEDALDRLLFVQSNDVILRICSKTEKKGEKDEFSTTFINSIDPRDDKVSCVIPDSKIISASTLGNGDLVLTLYAKISIINVTTCDYETIETISGIPTIIPHHDSFSVVKAHHERLSPETFEDIFDVEVYDVSGKMIEDYQDIARTNFGGHLEPQGAQMQNPDGSVKYLLFRHLPLRSCLVNADNNCHYIVVDIYNETYHRVESHQTKYLMNSYSTAHNRLSICSQQTGLKCISYDHNLNVQFDNQVMTRTNFLDMYQLISVHNLIDGGAIVVFCDEKTKSECHLYYVVIDAQGRVRGNHRYSLDPSYRSGAKDDTFFRFNGRPSFKPVIFEKDVENGIYCIVMPHTELIRGKCISAENNEIRV